MWAPGPYQHALERLEALTRGHDRFICTDVGQHQMWAAQFIRVSSNRHWITSGGAVQTSAPILAASVMWFGVRIDAARISVSNP